MRLDRGSVDDLLESGEFEWLAGIEDTFITAPSPRTGRTLDEYELTEHDRRWRSDLDLFAELGVRRVRYGIPWHRINPAPNVWDFTSADAPLERLLELGIDPIVDLVHYGVPAWIENAFLHPDFDRFMSEYSARIAERFRGRIAMFTPLNEPRITAWYCGKLGWWPPFRRGWRGFVAVMIGLCRGIVASVEAIRRVDPAIVHAHVDATDLYATSDDTLGVDAHRRQEMVFLALDLLSGRVRGGHPLYDFLLSAGVSPAELEWFEARALDLDLIGINLYPMFSEKRLVRTRSGVRIRMRYASAGIIDRLADLYWERYRRPLFISETASEGTVRRRAAWLEDSVTAVRRVRSRGVPLVGYTWWPLFALVTWGYREGRKPPHEYLRQMGLWDLRPSPHGLERVRTPLVERFRELVAQGAAAAGPFVRERSHEHGGADVS